MPQARSKVQCPKSKAGAREAAKVAKALKLLMVNSLRLPVDGGRLQHASATTAFVFNPRFIGCFFAAFARLTVYISMTSALRSTATLC
jgi:hypothetical protein